MSSNHPATSPVLLYDGACGFCAESVQLVLRHDRAGTLRFAALDSDFGRAVRGRHPELAGVDSVVLLLPAEQAPNGERVLTRSAAALAVADYLGGAWRTARLARLVPRSLRDRVYDFVARHRHRLRPGGPQCVVSTPEQRDRFLS